MRDGSRATAGLGTGGCGSGRSPRVLGRNGRTLQAVRRVLTVAAAQVGQALTLEIHGDEEDTRPAARSATRSDVATEREKPRRKS
ncbi:MAG: hypothetical protein HC918_14285 [Oscillatoriales cyanobacterium SM2_1_8]|nr:hypothetical protein [Oscillatoriales cyanobacterium SM2_1_8]